MQTYYDFFIWNLNDQLFIRLRKGETIVFTLQSRFTSEKEGNIENNRYIPESERKQTSQYRKNLTEWAEAWGDFFEEKNPSVTNIINHIVSIEVREEKTDTFVSSYERYVWITIVLALLSYLKNTQEQANYEVSELISRIHSYLQDQWKRAEIPFFFFDPIKKEDDAIKEAMWHDMRPFVEFGIISGKRSDVAARKQIRHFLEGFIRQTRKEHKERSSRDSLPLLGLLQLYVASLVFGVNTADLGKWVNRIFRLDDEVVNPFLKRDMLIWAVEKVGELKKQDDDSESRQAVLIHAIGDNYFRNYDVDNALTFWSKLEKKTFPLPLLIKIYHGYSPYVLVGSWMIGLLLLWQKIAFDPDFVGFIASVFAVITILLLFGVAASFVRNRGFVFGHLFLQRLVGASVVGLSILAVTPEGWRIGLCSNPLAWIIIISSTFFLAWSLIFFKIYRDSIRSGYNFVTEKVSLHKKTFSISSKILAIHAIFTLIIVFLVSGFLSHIFIPELLQQCEESNRMISSSDWVWGALEFGFSPKLILLWTGISIFIGVFAQLLWDEHEVTSG